ncbi:MAG: hypothetical protein SXU28_13935, partial [Pseudomonadota bacterium]|nr:hypothetical protein [Pseudomonadota bacterium]
MAGLDSMLANADFDLAADITIAPARARRGASAESYEAPQIEVALEDNEDAVVLIEQQGGVFRWSWPADSGADGRQRRGGGGARRAVFDLVPQGKDSGFSAANPPDSEPRRRRGIPLAGWIGERLIEPIRVRVLRFIARKVTDAVIDKVEGDLREGPRHWDMTRNMWVDGLPALSPDSSPRILLFVHGTFSSTANSFGGIAAYDSNPAMPLEIVNSYDAMIGFDHKTLALTPLENAAAMNAAFAGLPEGSFIDAVAFSRGGLVYRAFERAFAASRPDVHFGKAVFVGCTNAGTFLAHPENWKALVDLYTTIVLASVRAISVVTGFGGVDPVSFAIKAIGDFVKIMPQLAIDGNEVPGLAAMQPGSAVLSELEAREEDLGRYHAITS